MNLANKYRPRTWEDVTEQNVAIEILKNLCEDEGLLTNRNFLLTGPAGVGKAQPLHSKILTTDGFITMGEIVEGMQVFTRYGDVGTVTGIYPQGVRPIFKISFNDSSFIEVSDEHLNIVKIYDGGSGEYIDRVVTLNELLSLIVEVGGMSIWVDDVPENIKRLYPESSLIPRRHITCIEYIGDMECQCIYVDHPDHTYISDNFIPTHNTTTARIIGRTLNADEGGEFIEIDGASHNGVDSVREIVSQAQQYPIGAKYKIFIIDECHCLTLAAWSSFLKALEAGLARSVFIFATTNPEKIPATILSRVQTFNLSKISLDGIFKRLKYVLDSEISEGRNLKYDDDAVYFIAKLANGGMRDALTYLDKVLAFSNQVDMDSVSSSLNLPDYDQYFKLLNGYAKKDNSVVTQVVNDVYNSGINFVKWFEGFHSFVMNVVKYIFIQDISQTMIPVEYQGKISKYTNAHSIICLRLANKLIDMNNALKSTQYLQEMALTYLCQISKK